MAGSDGLAHGLFCPEDLPVSATHATSGLSCQNEESGLFPAVFDLIDNSLFIHILDYIKTRDIIRVIPFVAKRWHAVSAMSLLWRNRRITLWGSSSAFKRRFQRYVAERSIRSIRLLPILGLSAGLPAESNSLCAAMPSVFDLLGTLIHRLDISQLAAVFPNIRSLELLGVPPGTFTDHFNGAFQLAESVKLSFCYDHSLDDDDYNVLLPTLLKKFPRATSLHLAEWMTLDIERTLAVILNDRQMRQIVITLQAIVEEWCVPLKRAMLPTTHGAHYVKITQSAQLDYHSGGKIIPCKLRPLAAWLIDICNVDEVSASGTEEFCQYAGSEMDDCSLCAVTITCNWAQNNPDTTTTLILRDAENVTFGGSDVINTRLSGYVVSHVRIETTGVKDYFVASLESIASSAINVENVTHITFRSVWPPVGEKNPSVECREKLPHVLSLFPRLSHVLFECEHLLSNASQRSFEAWRADIAIRGAEQRKIDFAFRYKHDKTRYY